MNRNQKEETVAWLSSIFSESGSVIVARYSGLNVSLMSELRARMREKSGTFKVAKNRLAKIALQNVDCSDAADMFTGPTGIAFANDPVGIAKAAVEFSDKHEQFVILGGLLGNTVLDDKGVEALSKMPSLDEMRSKLLGTLQQPGASLAVALHDTGQRLARTLNAPASNLLNVLNAQKAKLDDAA